jgi:hypothetical protein
VTTYPSIAASRKSGRALRSGVRTVEAPKKAGEKPGNHGPGRLPDPAPACSLPLATLIGVMQFLQDRQLPSLVLIEAVKEGQQVAAEPVKMRLIVG